jgi:hypothetical protein
VHVDPRVHQTAGVRTHERAAEWPQIGIGRRDGHHIMLVVTFVPGKEEDPVLANGSAGSRTA